MQGSAFFPSIPIPLVIQGIPIPLEVGFSISDAAVGFSLEDRLRMQTPVIDYSPYELMPADITGNAYLGGTLVSSIRKNESTLQKNCMR